MIHNLKDIHGMLQTDFPVEECTIKSDKEDGIYNSNKQYLCMILDNRFQNHAELRIMTPYIWVGNDLVHIDEYKQFKDFVGCGWIDDSGYFIDHYNNPIHGEDEYEYVIGFTEYINSSDENLWDIIPNLD